MSRAVGLGAPGVPGAPAAPPVGQAPWAGREPALQATCCVIVGDRTFKGSNASTLPAQVGSLTQNKYISEWKDLKLNVYTILYLLLLLCFHPVDGEWLPWVSWSNCSSDCGGVRIRHRGCIPPRYGGRDCSQLPESSNLAMEISTSCLKTNFDWHTSMLDTQ